MNTDILFKKINKFAEDTEKLKLTEDQIFAIFDAIKRSVNSKRRKVQTQQAVAENQQKIGGYYSSPVCMIDVASAKPSKNWIDYAPALIIRFGTFPEQPYDDISKQMEYALNLLEGTYNKNDFFLEKVEKVSPTKEHHITRNSNYNNQYIALFYKE